VFSDAQERVRDILLDARMGRQVELQKVEPVVERILQSVLRNPGALTSLGRVKQKDNYTFQHSVNVGVLLVNFCQHLGMDAAIIRDAAVGGLLHDIGKMKTPDTILNKPGKLSDQEFLVMRGHVTSGVEILRDVAGLSAVALEIVAQHHEHVDGGGYPIGLKGDAISQLGQMAAIVDVYDALTSIRIYHEAMEPTQALRKLFEWSKFHFNPDLVQRFIQCIGIYPVGTLVRLESGLIGLVVEESAHNLLRPTVRIVYDSRRDVRVTPRDLDLAAPHVTDQIVSHESASRWKIDPADYV
jgi:putative nucleotidyltransferase with HDIG domain